MNKKVKSVVKSVLDDLSSNDPIALYWAIRNLQDERWLTIMEEAGCPRNILDAMLDSMDLSTVERKFVAAKIKERL